MTESSHFSVDGTTSSFLDYACSHIGMILPPPHEAGKKLLQTQII